MTALVYRGGVAASTVGELLREWRARRRRSQLDVALDVGVSSRHLSFVETGRAKPSPELVLALASRLDVPLRERNTLLIAAGYAPRFGQTPLDDRSMARVRAALDQMLDAHDPYPGLVLDRYWNVVAANAAAAALTASIPEALLGPPLNVFRASLHPDGLASSTLNFADWASYLVATLRRLVARTADPVLDALLAEVMGYPNVAELVSTPGWAPDEAPLLVPCRLLLGGAELSLFTTLTTFGTPGDITLDEVAVELFYPADDATDRALRAGPPSPLRRTAPPAREPGAVGR
jgi:transcriptional regulator with XRE-family HTH domain